MWTIRRRRLAIINCLLLLLLGCARADQSSAGKDVFDRLVENWRWSRYWFGKTGIDDVYSEGKQVSVLIFWTKQGRRPKSGMCSTELSLCIAYSGPQLSPSAERMHIGGRTSVMESFHEFVSSQFGGAESYINAAERLAVTDFEIAETSVTMPALTPPASVVEKIVPAEARREADRVKRLLGCGGGETSAPAQSCSGTLVFAFYGPADPYWFVLRTCSAACQFKGSIVEELTRGDAGWEVTSRGYISSPTTEVERLKQQIEKAEMFRLALR